jgi:hypothetical protein
MPELRFRLALTVKDLGAAFRLRDQTGMAIAYVYYEDRPEWQLGCPHAHRRRSRTHCNQHREFGGAAASMKSEGA